MLSPDFRYAVSGATGGAIMKFRIISRAAILAIGTFLFVGGQGTAQTVSDICPQQPPGHAGWVVTMKCIIAAAKSGNGVAAEILARDYDGEGFFLQVDMDEIGLPNVKGDRKFDRQQAVYWYTAAANAGRATAMNRLFNISQLDAGLDNPSISEVDGVSWLRKAIAAGDTQSLSDMCGYSLNKSHDYAEALRDCTAAANKGNPGAQFTLGRIYAEGRGEPQNHALAAQWFQRAMSSNTVYAGFAREELDKLNAADGTTAEELRAKKQQAAQAAALELNFKKSYLAAKLEGGEKSADLQFSVSFDPGGWVRLIKIISHEDAPLRIYKVVINRHYNNPTCSLVKDMSDNYLVLQTVSLGNAITVEAPGICDDPVKVEVFTNRGIAEYDFN